MVDFHGWEMPINYGSQISEHHYVRKACGIFDVSHMTIIDVLDNGANDFMKKLLANDVSNLKEDYDALYSPLLNINGGIKDDLIVSLMPFGFRMVVNCATRSKDLDWIKEISSDFKVDIKEREDLAMIALQGPKSENIIKDCINEKSYAVLEKKKSFQGLLLDEIMISRTGYTGEKGFEIISSKEIIKNIWKQAIKANAKPIGLGARDTLRLEAGMNLYGYEMDESISPLECNMSYYVSLKDKNRDFIGKNSYIMKKKLNNHTVLKGVLIDDRVIIRRGQEIYVEGPKGLITGIVTSGSFSPTLQKSIALVRVPKTDITSCYALVRGKKVNAALGEPRFINQGKSIF